MSGKLGGEGVNIGRLLVRRYIRFAAGHQTELYSIRLRSGGQGMGARDQHFVERDFNPLTNVPEESEHERSRRITTGHLLEKC
jgi:hypothetical protein